MESGLNIIQRVINKQQTALRIYCAEEGTGGLMDLHEQITCFLCTVEGISPLE